MPRIKRYRKRVMLTDIILTLVTGGFWLVIVGFREWRARVGN